MSFDGENSSKHECLDLDNVEAVSPADTDLINEGLGQTAAADVQVTYIHLEKPNDPIIDETTLPDDSGQDLITLVEYINLSRLEFVSVNMLMQTDELTHLVSEIRFAGEKRKFFNDLLKQLQGLGLALHNGRYSRGGGFSFTSEQLEPKAINSRTGFVLKEQSVPRQTHSRAIEQKTVDSKLVKPDKTDSAPENLDPVGSRDFFERVELMFDGDQRIRQNWERDGECIGIDQPIFYPGRGEDETPAKQICAGCSVRAECLAKALIDSDKFGIKGGMSGRERRSIKKRLNERKQKADVHNTD